MANITAVISYAIPAAARSYV
jgi:flagellar biosynthesis/type III secretory pathway M-ring protein FliF/YscJ